MKVYLAISEVASKLAKDGISKDRKNVSQGYAFRGIDDVYNALAPYLSESKLCILPSVLERDVVERTNQKGTALFYVTVKVRFDFVSAEDGSKHEVVTYGEAMDSGDKATNKAMSAAFKYACMQAFCIPTEGDNDADSQTHEVKAKAPPQKSNITPNADAGKSLTPEQKQKVDGIASEVIDCFEVGQMDTAYDVIEEAAFDMDEKLYLWSLLGSAIRSALKKIGIARREAKGTADTTPPREKDVARAAAKGTAELVAAANPNALATQA